MAKKINTPKPKVTMKEMKAGAKAAGLPGNARIVNKGGKAPKAIAKKESGS